MNIVLQKYISEAGVCSRRQAEVLIKNGRVRVNDVVAELGQRAGGADKVEVNGKLVSLIKEKIYIKINKPSGVVCTNRKYENEKNIFDLVDSKEKLFVVGRLDKKSTGLVLLSNDGDMAYKLTHPKFEHEKEYEVKIKNKNVKIKDIEDKFIKGVDIEEKSLAKAKDVKYVEKEKFIIILTEGKKRQIRRMFEKFDLEVEELKRVRIANLKLDNLKEGEWKVLSKSEISELLKI